VESKGGRRKISPLPKNSLERDLRKERERLSGGVKLVEKFLQYYGRQCSRKWGVEGWRGGQQPKMAGGVVLKRKKKSGGRKGREAFGGGNRKWGGLAFCFLFGWFGINAVGGGLTHRRRATCGNRGVLWEGEFTSQLGKVREGGWGGSVEGGNQKGREPRIGGKKFTFKGSVKRRYCWCWGGNKYGRSTKRYPGGDFGTGLT